MKKHAIGLALVIVALGAFASSSWEGSAVVGGAADYPSEGYYASCNSFPRGSEVEIRNLENGKVVTVTITGPVDNPGVFMTFSPKAAAELGVKSGTATRIRATALAAASAPLSPAAAGSAGGTAQRPASTLSKDPDFNPSLLADPARVAAARSEAAKPTSASPRAAPAPAASPATSPVPKAATTTPPTSAPAPADPPPLEAKPAQVKPESPAPSISRVSTPGGGTRLTIFLDEPAPPAPASVPAPVPVPGPVPVEAAPALVDSGAPIVEPTPPGSPLVASVHIGPDEPLGPELLSDDLLQRLAAPEPAPLALMVEAVPLEPASAEAPSTLEALAGTRPVPAGAEGTAVAEAPAPAPAAVEEAPDLVEVLAREAGDPTPTSLTVELADAGMPPEAPTDEAQPLVAESPDRPAGAGEPELLLAEAPAEVAPEGADPLALEKPAALEGQSIAELPEAGIEEAEAYDPAGLAAAEGQSVAELPEAGVEEAEAIGPSGLAATESPVPEIALVDPEERAEEAPAAAIVVPVEPDAPDSAESLAAERPGMPAESPGAELAEATVEEAEAVDAARLDAVTGGETSVELAEASAEVPPVPAAAPAVVEEPALTVETRVALVPTEPRPPAPIALAPEATPPAVKPAVPPVAAVSPPSAIIPTSRPAAALPERLAFVDKLAKGSYYIQIGVFSGEESVARATQDIASAYPLRAERVMSPSGEKIRLYVGPLNRDEGGVVLLKIKSLGFKDAFIKQGT